MRWCSSTDEIAKVVYPRTTNGGSKMEKVIVRTKRFGVLETTVKAVDHEVMRFEYMTRDQLFRRLEKVTNPKKLVAMIKACRGFGRRGLERAVQSRMVELYG